MVDDATRAKLAKLDALASDRNPNAHEREVARRKAQALRQRAHETAPAAKRPLPPPATKVGKIKYLNDNLLTLKPGDQLLVAEYCMTFYSQGRLDDRQWNAVNMYVKEIYDSAPKAG